MSLLSLRGLTIRFGQDVAVDNLSLDLEPGHMLALVGESGSGKSVTAFTTMGLNPKEVKPVSGEIILQGEDLLKKSDAEMRRLRGEKMAMIFQEPRDAGNSHQPLGGRAEKACARGHGGCLPAGSCEDV